MENINDFLKSIREESENIKKLSEEVVTLTEANILIQRLMRRVEELENENDLLATKLEEIIETNEF